MTKLIVALASSIVLLTLTQAASAADGDSLPTFQGNWECVVKEAAFSPRDTAEGVVFDGKMWLSNGYFTGNVLTRDLWNSSDGKTWTLVNDATPYDGYSEMVVYENKMWAIKNSVWTSTDGKTWTQVLKETPFGQCGYGETVVHDGKMWQLGSGEGVWWSTDGATWTVATEHAPYGGRVACAVTVYDGKIWLMGGRTERPSTPPEKHYAQYTTHNDVWCSKDGAQWECVLEQAPWKPRMWVVPNVYAGCMWIIGGFDNRNSVNCGDVWYTKDGKTWQEFKAETVFAPRHEVTSYVFDNSLWVVDGNTWPVVNDVWRLTLAGQ